MIGKIFTHKDIPKKSEEEAFSVDVIICFHDNLLNIGYWSFEDERWKFHANTLYDPYEKGEVFPFKWMYPPEELIYKQSQDG